MKSILGKFLSFDGSLRSSAMVGLVDATEKIKNYMILLNDWSPENKTAWDKAIGMSLDKDKLMRLTVTLKTS